MIANFTIWLKKSNLKKLNEVKIQKNFHLNEILHKLTFEKENLINQVHQKDQEIQILKEKVEKYEYEKEQILCLNKEIFGLKNEL
jgi:hypothetical protein